MTQSLISEHTAQAISPIDGALIAEVPMATVSDVEAAVVIARNAFENWSSQTPVERANVLQACAAQMRAVAGEVARALTLESGKPLMEAEFEVAAAADVFDYYASLARTRGGRLAPQATPTSTSLVIKEPLGVVGAILPWNYPLLLWSWKAAPALAAGNTIIAKPSPETMLSLPLLVAALDLPEGVHQILQGGADIGEALVLSRGIDKIAFTGSSAVGKKILALCAQDAKRCSVEMSGHDAMIVWDDVDLDLAVEAALFAKFANNGQVCTAAERFFVRDTIVDEFTAKLAVRMSALLVGDPLAPGTDVGPLASFAHQARLVDYCRRAREAGAEFLLGGEPIDGAGAYFQPTLIRGLNHEQINELGEIFGPVAPIVPIATFEEGIAYANDNRFGLSCNVLVGDLGLAMKAAWELKVGTVWINNPLPDNYAAPFGGFREAGLGRELGEEGFDAYTEAKHVWIEHGLTSQPHWYSERRL
ncbi:aldehyde dehydrogenase [Leifsonia sp. YAF41]|uniref:aldehyde dehydrogenase family protein n=1 Tax=Leifsonia sp. YAF41 TaxID=3233086 RepID=UPI003F94A60C